MVRAVALVLVLGGAACARPCNWERHDAWRCCRGAIAAWPRRPAPPCAALQLCANEAPLAPAEQRKLRQMIRSVPACAEP